jgi:sortase (surface protein transpeptidase)
MHGKDIVLTDVNNIHKPIVIKTEVVERTDYRVLSRADQKRGYSHPPKIKITLPRIDALRGDPK